MDLNLLTDVFADILNVWFGDYICWVGRANILTQLAWVSRLSNQ